MMLMGNRGRAARLHFMGNHYRVLSGGDHVLCAATGVPIPLDELKYWSVARQEPYATARASVEADIAARRA